MDSPTARHLFEKCILGALKGRTVLLVSHSASLILPKADFVVALQNGTILTSGSSQEVLKNKTVFDLLSNSSEAPVEVTNKKEGDEENGGL